MQEESQEQEAGPTSPDAERCLRVTLSDLVPKTTLTKVNKDWVKLLLPLSPPESTIYQAMARASSVCAIRLFSL